MGGLRSGRRWKGGKEITDDYHSLHARRWQRDGLLTPGQAFGWHWSLGGEKVAFIDLRTERSCLNNNARATLDHFAACFARPFCKSA